MKHTRNLQSHFQLPPIQCCREDTSTSNLHMDLHVWGSRCGMRSWHLIGSSFLLMMASLRRMHGYGGRPNRSPGTWPLLPKGTRKWPVRSIPVAECTYCSISLVELWWYLQSPWISTPITSTISSFLHQIGSFLRGLCLTRVRSTSVEYHWALWCKRRSEPPRLGLRDQAWTFNELSGEVEKVGGIVDTLMLQPGTSTTPALHSATKSQCVWRLRYECQRAQVLNFLVYFLQIHAIF